MFQLISAISPIYSPRHYIVAKTDQMSEKKAISFEESQDPKAKVTIFFFFSFVFRVLGFIYFTN